MVYNMNTMTRDALLLFGDFHFHTAYSDNEDEATVRRMVETGRARGLRSMAPADHHHSLTPTAWAALLRDIGELADDGTTQLYEACEISFRRGHLVALRPEVFPGRVADGFDVLYAKRCEAMIIAHPVTGMDRWRHILYPAVDGIEVINGEVLRYFRRRRIPFRTFDSIPMLSLYKRYLKARLPVAAIGSSDAHRVTSIGFGVTGLWLRGADDTALNAIRERRCYAATDTGVFMKWSLNGGTLSWQTAIDGEPPRHTRIYRGGKPVATAAAAGTIDLPKPGCYWIAIGSRERIGVSSAIEVLPYDTEGIGKRELNKILKDAAYLQNRHGNAEATDWVSRRHAKWVAVYCDTPRFYDLRGTRRRLPCFPTPGRKVFIRKKDTIAAFADVEPWIAAGESHEYAIENISWERRGNTLRIRGTAAPGLRVVRPGSTSGNSTIDLRSAADLSVTVDLRFRMMRRWMVRLPPGDDTYIIRDGRRESVLGTVAVQLPEQFRLRGASKTANLSTEIQLFT